MKHLLEVINLTSKEITEILDLADQLEGGKEKGNPSREAEREDAWG